MPKEELIQVIIEHADEEWIRHFIDDVVEFDWGAELKRFPEDTLKMWVKELGVAIPA